MKVSKEFWVSDEHLDKINSDGELSLILRNKDESSFMDSVINKATNKITISYEIDQGVTIKKSELKGVLNKYLVSGLTVDNIMTAVFGGGENE